MLEKEMLHQPGIQALTLESFATVFNSLASLIAPVLTTFLNPSLHLVSPAPTHSHIDTTRSKKTKLHNPSQVTPRPHHRLLREVCNINFGSCLAPYWVPSHRTCEVWCQYSSVADLGFDLFRHERSILVTKNPLTIAITFGEGTKTT